MLLGRHYIRLSSMFKQRSFSQLTILKNIKTSCNILILAGNVFTIGSELPFPAN